MFDAHRDDPESGYRFLVAESADAGQPMAERTAWRICSGNGWWSTFGKRRRGKKTRVGAPAHDDLVRRAFTAPGPNQVWLSDLTEHPTRDGRLYLRAIKDAWSNWIVGYVLNRQTDTRGQLRLAIVTWIERTYHRRRRQLPLGRLTPVEYELIMSQAADRAA